MGMFDSVYFGCPHCGEQTEVQSKAGFCVLDNFYEDAVPTCIAQDLDRERHFCKHCEKVFEVIMLGKPATLRMRAVKL